MCNQMLTIEIRERVCCLSTQQKLIVRLAHFLHYLHFKFNLKGACYTGHVRQTNLALIIRPDSNSIVPLEALVRCLNRIVGLLCHKNVLKSLTSLRFSLEPRI